MKYYSTAAIDKRDATYNVIFGERSNGKTYAIQILIALRHLISRLINPM